MRPFWTIEALVPRVRGGVFADPNSVIFGTIPRGSNRGVIVRLYDNGVSGRQIERVRSLAPERFEARLLPPAEGGDQEVHETAGRLIGQVEVVARTERAGPLEGYVEVTLAGDKRSPSLIPVTGGVASTVVCSPSTLLLPYTVGNRLVYSGQVLLTSRDGEPFQAEVEAVPDGLSATVRPVAGRPDQYRLQISCSAVPVTSHGTRESRVRLRIQLSAALDENPEVAVFHPRGGP